MTTSIQERAMLVNLSISAWTASKKDNKVSNAVKANQAASAKAGWFNKRLIEPSHLEPINQIEGRARAMHYKMTLPWGDNGDRMLPSQAYFDYTDQLRQLRAEHEVAVLTFVASYPQMVQDARVMLGAMYEPADYPEANRIAERFSMNAVFSPVANAEDFRVDIGQEAVDEIKKSITAAAEQRLAGATRDCWVRLCEVVGNMAERLHDPKAIFKDSLVGNIEALLDLLPKLNVANDYVLERVCHEVHSWLIVAPTDLRKNKKLRAFTADKALEILEQIKPWTLSTHAATI